MNSEATQEHPCPVCGGHIARHVRTLGKHAILHCQGCEFWFQWPPPTSEEVATAFNDYPWTSNYAAITPAAREAATRALAKKLDYCEALSGRRPTSMLDVGCGNGLHMLAARDLGLDCVGTEVDKTNADRARAIGLCIHDGPLNDLDIPADTFDFVHVKQVIFCLYDVVIFLRACIRALRPGGVIFFDINNQNGFASLIRRWMLPSSRRHGQVQPPKNPVAFNRISLHALVHRVGGLKIVMQTSYSFGDACYYPVLDPTGRSLKQTVIRAGTIVLDRFGGGGFIAVWAVKTLN